MAQRPRKKQVCVLPAKPGRGPGGRPKKANGESLLVDRVDYGTHHVKYPDLKPASKNFAKAVQAALDHVAQLGFVTDFVPATSTETSHPLEFKVGGKLWSSVSLTPHGSSPSQRTFCTATTLALC